MISRSLAKRRIFQNFLKSRGLLGSSNSHRPSIGHCGKPDYSDRRGLGEWRRRNEMFMRIARQWLIGVTVLAAASTPAFARHNNRNGGLQQDIGQDRQEIQQLQQQLRNDQQQLRRDEASHAGKSIIKADKRRIKQDKKRLQREKADLKHDRRRYGYRR